MKLTIELIPKTSFFTNVRSLVSNKWDKLRKDCYKKANYMCEICSGRGDKWPVECHEVWSYNYSSKTQRLERLIALCPACHECKHLGLAKIRGRLEQATEHFKQVNNLTDEQAEKEIAKAWAEWDRKNTVRWKLDISHLETLA